MARIPFLSQKDPQDPFATVPEFGVSPVFIAPHRAEYDQASACATADAEAITVIL